MRARDRCHRTRSSRRSRLKPKRCRIRPNGMPITPRPVAQELWIKRAKTVPSVCPLRGLMADLLVQDGVVLVFAWVFAVQAGTPIPAGPMLLGVGALSGSGQMNLALELGAAIAAALGADVLWYSLGRSQGTRLTRRSRS